MRAAFRDVVIESFPTREDLFLLLGDIGVFGFRDLIRDHPTRAINIGILEQSMVGVVPGLAASGFIPIVHSIAPFLIERAYEQVKLAVGYHQSNCRLVSIGASYDYINLGPTHHCPGDVAILSAIPNLEIIVPASPSDVRKLFLQSLDRDCPIYFRLSDNFSSSTLGVDYGENRVVHYVPRSSDLILSIGPMIDIAQEVARDLRIGHINCTTLVPFDNELIFEHLELGGNLHIIEPFYVGSSGMSLCSLSKSFRLRFYGFEKSFVSTCGSWSELLLKNHLTPELLKRRIVEGH